MISASASPAACKPFSREEQWLTGQLKSITISIYKQHIEKETDSSYEDCFCAELEKRSIPFEGETDVQITGNDKVLGKGRRIDISADAVAIVVNGRSNLQPAWETQLRNYLKITGKRIGYVLNFPFLLERTDITQRVYYSGKDNLLLFTFSM
jgi:GxxExxY protein